MKLSAKQLQSILDGLPCPVTYYKLGRYEHRVIILQPPVITHSFVPEKRIEADELTFKISTDRHPPEWILNI